MILSIIVPVYNVEKYLAKCLDSLLNQDLNKEEYEVIVVNDGSTDSSGKIAQHYADNYSNVTIINQDNKGLSGARNTGIQHAQGEYIQFVDSDDYLETNLLKGLIQKMIDDDLDVLRFNYQNVNDKYEVYKPYKEDKPFVDYIDNVVDGLTFLTSRLGYACYAVQFMIKREFLVTNSIYFTNGIYFEDTEWAPRLLIKATKITSVDRMVYNYLLREGSITQSINIGKKRKVIEDKLLLIDSLKNQMRSISDKRWFEGMISATVVSVVNMIALEFYSERKYYLGELIKRDVFPLSMYQATKTAKRKIRFINISPRLCCWLINMKNR